MGNKRINVPYNSIVRDTRVECVKFLYPNSCLKSKCAFAEDINHLYV